MARTTHTRRKAARRKPRRGPAAAKSASTPWPTIEAFLDTEEGSISIGAINHSSLGYTAVATDEHDMLVALMRNCGETLHQLLDRLERALGPAIEDQVFVDEVNNP